jgi:multidrug efflux pump subunit AcrA (membrane-fusion protein)
MLAVMKINDYSNPEALVVPVNVVQNSGEEEFLFIAQKNDERWIAKKKVVTTGKNYDNKIEVLSNLSPGEKVITVGFQDLADNQPIELVENPI